MAASVSFTSDAAGWVLGSAPCKTAPCTFVARTVDGGRHWIAMPGPIATVYGAGVTKLRFADARDGFAFGGGALWTTHDGGTRWKKLPAVAGISPYVVSALEPTGAGVYAIVSGLSGPAAAGAGATDGNWRLVKADATGDNFAVVHHFSALDAFDLVANGDAVYVLDGNRVVKIVGNAITPMSLPAPNCGGPFAASSPSDLLLICGQGVGGGGMGDREAYGSIGSGRSWVRLADPNGVGFDNFGVADGGQGHALIAAGDAAGDGVIVTTDYARHWSTALTFPGDSEMGLGDLSYQDATHAVVIHGTGTAGDAQSHGGVPSFPGGGMLYRTTDGGDHWSRINF